MRHLVGAHGRYDDAVDQALDDASQTRTYRVRKQGFIAGHAEFFVLIGANGKALDAKFINGSEDLRPVTRALTALAYRQSIPDSSLTKLLRRGILSCNSSTTTTCDFVLYTTSMVHSAQ